MCRRKVLNPDALKSKLNDKIISCDGSDEQKQIVYGLAVKYLQALTYYTAPKYFDKALGFLATVMRLANFATRHNFTSAEWKENVHKPFFGNGSLPEGFEEVI